MWRTLGRPRWLLLLAVLVAVVIAFTRLGLWQLSVAQDDAVEQAQAEQAARPAEPVEEVLAPHGGFPEDGRGRSVLAVGAYDPARQFLVPDRVLAGESGYWVVTPVVVASTGARLPVVRGFVGDPALADSPGEEQVTVTGTLALGESPVSAPGLPEGQRGSVDLALLANQWPGELYNGFVFATGEQPRVTGPAVTPVPPPSFGGEVDWRNLGYALQWWVFAGFAVFMFWRLLVEDHRADRVSERHTLETAHERTEPHHV